MYTLDKNNTSPLCILCMQMPQITPLLTLQFVHGIKSPPIGCCFCRCRLIFLVPISAHFLLVLDKWFLQIYFNVYSKLKSKSKYYFDLLLLKLALEDIHLASTLNSPIMVGHNNSLESTLIFMMRTMWATFQPTQNFQQKINMGHINLYFEKLIWLIT